MEKIILVGNLTNTNGKFPFKRGKNYAYTKGK